jgi:Rrf2 family protein
MKYLCQLILPLKVAGLIISTRGAHGGYFLGKLPEEIMLSEIITSVEGSLNPVECVDNPDICQRSDFCATHEIWKEMGKQNLDFLQSRTLKDLIDMHIQKQKVVSQA